MPTVDIKRIQNALLLLCLLLGAGLSSARQQDHNPTSEMLPEGIDWSQAPTISIRMGDHYFEPEEITLQQNRPYRLILDNISDQVTHNISSQPLFHSVVLQAVVIAGVTINTPHLHHLTLRPNSKTKLFLFPLKSGEMEFHCNVPGHREGGMEGFINIKP